MKLLKTAIVIFFISISPILNAQEDAKDADTGIDKKSYYQKRAEEDAKYEQQFKAETEAEEKAFWKEQKAYEKELKRKDRVAHRAYMKGKRDAYAEHYQHCDAHCHHGHYYYNHASFYYYRYDSYYYRAPRNSNSINTNIRVSTPRVSVGLGL